MVALRTKKVQKNVIMGVHNPQKMEITWINISAIPQFMPGEKKPFRVYTIFDDITERKKVENALEQSEAKYRELFENAQIGMYRSRIDGSAFIEVNQKMADILGFGRDELIKTPSRILWADPGERDRLAALMKERGGSHINYETRMLTKNGDLKDVLASIELHEKEGYVEGTLADITEQKRALDGLRESEKRYRTLFENMQEGYAYCRIQFDERARPVDWTYLDVNRAFGRITGLENVVGKRATDVLPNIMKLNPELLQMYGRVVSTGKPETRDVDISGLGLRAGWLNMSAFRPAEGDFVAVFSDITERKKVERTLRRALMRFELEEGRLYMIMEGGPHISFEAFTDLLRAGYEGFVVTRSAGAGSELWRQLRCTVLSLSVKGGKGALPPDASVIGDWAEGLTPGKAIFFDRLDYLVTRLGFKETLFLVHRLGEIASLNNHIMIIAVDPATLDARRVRLLEKEGTKIEPLVKESVPEDLLETMRHIYEKNIVGVRPTLTSIGRDLGLSKPTVRKRMWKLLRLGYIVSHLNGRSKALELTEKGRSVFLR
jgi:PAS domain S-box-containing protein